MILLTDAQIEKNKQDFIAELSKVKREGIDKLIEWLSSPDPKDCDFFIAPSSTVYHGNYKGGLCQHSLNVYRCLKELVPLYIKMNEERGRKPVKITEDEMRVVALLHDLCKVQFYYETERSYKDDNGMWNTYQTYSINDRFPFGHGEKSCFLIQRFMMLSGVEALAIRWHMGLGDISVHLEPTHKAAFNKAWDICPLAYLLHQADCMSSYLLEDKIAIPGKK